MEERSQTALMNMDSFVRERLELSVYVKQMVRQEQSSDVCKSTDSYAMQENGDSDRVNSLDQEESVSSLMNDKGYSNQESLTYKLTDTPPIPLLIFFALQQSFLVISTPLTTTVVVAEAVCALEDDALKLSILCSTFFMMGLSTLAMTTIGIRLPVFQGPNPMYILPLLFLKTLDEFKCPETFFLVDPTDNSTALMAKLGNDTTVPNRYVSLERINAYAGTLMVVGVIHFLIGATGFVSVVARFVGPITIVPVVLLFGIYIHEVVTTFVETHWPTALLTSATILVLGLYLEHRDTPIPVWTPSKGFRITWQPLHRILAILIGIILGWIVCAVLTVTGSLNDDKTSKEYLARTDARLDIVHKADWIMFPYPGQFGTPNFSVAALVPFLISCILSVLDSIGDYNATAKVTSTPIPPKYALNRGIAVEGLMSILSGAFGCSHATVSFGENIGAIGISGVASRSVFQAVGVIYMVLAFLGKFGAVFISIPYSVVGGTQIVTFGILIGVILSYLETIDLQSQRNLSILGISIMMGMIVPHWILKNPLAIDTGTSELNNIVVLLLSNPSFIGGIVACFLDNTVPGTLKGRGITDALEEINDNSGDYKRKKLDNSLDIYRLPFSPLKWISRR